MDELVDDVIIYIIINYLDLNTIHSFLLTSKRMIKFKDQNVVKIHIIKELLGDQGIELFHVINNLEPNTKNLLIPTNDLIYDLNPIPNTFPVLTSKSMMLPLIKVLTVAQVNFKICRDDDLSRKSLDNYISSVDFHIMIMSPRILGGQTIKNVNNVLIYNSHKGFSMHREQIIHKSNNIRHINTKKIKCIDIGDKGIEYCKGLIV